MYVLILKKDLRSPGAIIQFEYCTKIQVYIISFLIYKPDLRFDDLNTVSIV